MQREKKKQLSPWSSTDGCLRLRNRLCVVLFFLITSAPGGANRRSLSFAGRKNHRDKDVTPGAGVHIQTIAVLAQRLQEEFPSVWKATESCNMLLSSSPRKTRQGETETTRPLRGAGGNKTKIRTFVRQKWSAEEQEEQRSASHATCQQPVTRLQP